MAFRIEQTGTDGLQASFSADPIYVTTTSKQDDKVIEIRVESDRESISVDLPHDVVKLLVLQCLGNLPAPPAAPEEDAYRVRGLTLKSLDDFSLQLLLRDIKDETAAALLWYLKDAEFAKRIVRLGSRRRGRELLDELKRTWQGKDPDSVPYEVAREGRQAIFETLQAAWRLACEGQIPPIPARVDPPFFLSPDEVDALLKGVAEDE